MQNIIKRLEIIRSSIPLEDIEIIELQTLKLSKMEIDDEVQNILNHIDNSNFSPVIDLITNYINRFSGLQIYTNPRISGLKLELKLLEKEFLKLSDRKSSIENLINEFNHQFILRVGELLSKVLRKRAEKEAKNRSEAEEEFKNFREEFQQEQKKEELKKIITKEEQKSLKKLYREASKICHPDIVPEDKRSEAEEIFKELNEAYSINDLEKVSEILENLKTGNFGTGSEKIEDFELLQRKVSDLKAKIEKIKNEISELESDETYFKIVDLDDWEIYFSEVEESLKQDIYANSPN
jgi:hypothetical protein